MLRQITLFHESFSWAQDKRDSTHVLKATCIGFCAVYIYPTLEIYLATATLRRVPSSATRLGKGHTSEKSRLIAAASKKSVAYSFTASSTRSPRHYSAHAALHWLSFSSTISRACTVCSAAQLLSHRWPSLSAHYSACISRTSRKQVCACNFICVVGVRHAVHL